MEAVSSLIEDSVMSRPGLAKVRPEMTAEERELARVLGEMQELVGTRLLAAGDPEELDALLDEGLECVWPRQGQLRAEIHEAVAAYTAGKHVELGPSARPDYEAILSAPAAELMDEAARVRELVNGCLQSHPEHGRPLGPLRDPLWFVQLSVPVEFGEAFLRKGRGTLARQALEHAMTQGKPLPDWLGLRLAEAVLAGERAMLRLAATIEGCRDLAAHVPKGERLELDRINAREERRAYQIRQMHGEALRSGSKVYPPGLSPGDD